MITTRFNGQKFARIEYGNQGAHTWYPVENLRWLRNRGSNFRFVHR